MITYICVALLLGSVTSSQFEIQKVERSVGLGGFYATESVKVTYKALEDASIFIHAVPLQYDRMIARIAFRRSAKETKRQYSHTKSNQIVNGVSVVQYKVNLGKISQHETGELYINIAYLNRFINKPQSITMVEDQKLLYEDSKYFVSPYRVKEEENAFKSQKIIEFDDDGEKRGLNVVVFKGSNNMGYNFTKTTIFVVNHNPLVQFKKVQKTIDVSHWGVIAIIEHYNIYNVGPSLKGQFSRISFSSQNVATGRTSFKNVEFELPYAVHGLYYRDEVGNISTSKAYRDDGSQVVRVHMKPRFGILGGWKSNWEIGYNINTDEVLYVENNHYQLRNLQLDYAISTVLSEDYKVKLVLPQGSYDVKLQLNGEPIDMNMITQETSIGYLDFGGKPTYILKNVKALGSLNVKYHSHGYSVYKKPIILSGIVFAVLLLWIALGRFQLRVFHTKEE